LNLSNGFLGLYRERRKEGREQHLLFLSEAAIMYYVPIINCQNAKEVDTVIAERPVNNKLAENISRQLPPLLNKLTLMMLTRVSIVSLRI
jgi:hypothetical protein